MDKVPAGLPASKHFHIRKFDATTKPMLLSEYAYLWPGATIAQSMKVLSEAMAFKALRLIDTYRAVSHDRFVPWVALAAVDMRESGCDPMGCLANGDPWNKKTVHYPVGVGPWKSKADSMHWALDSFEKGWSVNLRKIKWTIPEILFFCELWNGVLARMEPGTVPSDASPYLYSGAEFDGKPLYEKGKRKERLGDDGRMRGYWDPAQVDLQLGCMAFLKALESKGYNLTA